ncbi:DUF6481 family protein [Aureimonas sp. ME7]|uniref:DUF6481 family protein n=1 Tax=Aureimonas sp. ME7 TaxID=2744252 RepID=UPI0015F51D51|nr:DUF6481 family protein [Aureimonas sp. ME7]
MKTDTDFIDRRNAAKNAKAALLEKMKAKQNDPELEARRAERAAVVAAREEREAAKRRQRQEAEAEREAALAQERAAAKEAAEQAAVSERDKLIAQAMEDQAAQKAKRDARYAARQMRKG